MKKFYFVIIMFCILVGCNQYKDKKRNLINIPKINNYTFAIMDENGYPVFTILGNIELEASLKKEYKKENSDFVNIECDKIGKIKPKGFLEINQEQIKNNKFLIDFMIDFCPESDANSEHCIGDLRQFKKEINTNPTCQIVFGGLSKPRIVVSKKFILDKEKILSSQKFIP